MKFTKAAILYTLAAAAANVDAHKQRQRSGKAAKAAEAETVSTPEVVVATPHPGELVYSCALPDNEYEGPYDQYSGNTKIGLVHLTFSGGPWMPETEIILNVLKEYNTKATFFLLTDKINDDTQPLVDRMINEGHSIGSFGQSYKDLLYANMTTIEYEIAGADAKFRDLGIKPVAFRAPYGGIDNRVRRVAADNRYEIAMWSAGGNDWPEYEGGLDDTVTAVRFTLAEAGGIMSMEDATMAREDGDYLRVYLDQTMPYFNYVDYHTCRSGKPNASS